MSVLRYFGAMLTVLIDCGPNDQRLAATLAPLVPGAVDGLVREVILIDRGMGPDASKVAEHAGCRIVNPADMRRVVEAAKGEWLLLLEPGARLASGWAEAVVEHADDVASGRATTSAARFSPSPADRPGFLQRLRSPSTALARGLMITKEQAIGSARRADTLENMAKGIAATKLSAVIRAGTPAAT